MPFARVVTRLLQDAGLLAGRLRALGYTVEIARPGSRPDGVADLEINLDAWTPEVALRRATEFAQTGIDVFVAAGTFAVAEPEEAPDNGSQQIAADPVPETVRQPVPETTHSSTFRDLWKTLGVWIVVLGRCGRTLAAIGARRARALTSAAMTGARIVTRDAAGAVGVYFARRSEHRRQARLQRSERRRPRVVNATPRPKPQAARLPVIRRTRSRDYEWRTAGMFSLALAVGITLAWAAANRRPATPLPAAVIMRSNAVQQQVPFGPATMPAPAQANQRKTPKLPAVRSRAAARRQPASFGDEVVVRHFRTARTKPPSRPAVAVKRVVVND